MSTRRVLITGANGGIGNAMCQEFDRNGWEVLASDRESNPKEGAGVDLSMDLDRICNDEGYRRNRFENLLGAIPNGLDCLINNAAHQNVAPIEDIDSEEWRRSLNTNVTAPFLLVKELLPALHQRHGSVINITSVHSSLTKPGFSAYATSKSALEGLTRALAVELGGEIRVNGIAPAAIDTPMLRSGFEHNPDGLAKLAKYHPSGTLGRAVDVAELAFFLAQSPARFLNGAIIGLDGGMASRLHDPA